MYLYTFSNFLFQERLASSVAAVRKEMSPKNIDELLQSEEFSLLLSLFTSFTQDCRSPMFLFWSSYISMVQLLLQFVRATREGNWELHLATVRDMIPWMFAYDRLNYAKYMSVYWLQMQQLETSHPQAYQAFMNGEFSVQRSSQSFSKTAVDQTIEQTINKDTKTKGGIVGFSLKSGAVQRWVATAHERASVVDSCRRMAGINSANDSSHKDRSHSQISRDDVDMKNLQIIASDCNPFDPSIEQLTSIVSGRIALQDVEKDLMNAHEKGEQLFHAFVEERLVNKTKDFYSPVTRANLKTFSSMKAGSTMKMADGRKYILKADSKVFHQMLVIAQTRKLDMRDVLKYSLGPIPWSIATADGMLLKSVKSKLVPAIETESDIVHFTPDDACWLLTFQKHSVSWQKRFLVKRNITHIIRVRGSGRLCGRCLLAYINQIY